MKNIKRTFITMLLCVSGVLFSMISAQSKTISLDLNKVPITELIKEIESKTDYTFFINDSKVDVNKLVTVKVTNGSISKILETAFSKTEYDFQIENKQILLESKSLNKKSAQEGDSKTISGTITDESGEPIVGATITIVGTTKGTLTDMDGRFSIEVSNTSADLEVRYVGYNTQVLKAGDKKLLSLVLLEDSKLLDEVIVVGYGVQKKRDLTGSISSIKMSEEPVASVSSISHVLAGKAAGFQVNNVSAQPGGGTTFRIRGAGSPQASNDPLIIIDGFPVSAPKNDKDNIEAGKYKSGQTDNILGSINPNDIESIEILKDASSTAIYGSRAANGVIIITTKKGKSGTPVVKYSGNVAVQQMAEKYETLGARDFMLQRNRYDKEVWMRNAGLAPYGNSTSNPSKPYEPTYTDTQINDPNVNFTDWFDEVSRSGFQTQHNVSITGGTDATKYLVSGNFFSQDGVVKKNDISRYTGRANIEQKLSNYVTVGTNLTFSRNTYNNVPLGSGQNENASLLVSAAQFNPLLPIRDEAGEYSLNTDAAFLPNPVSLLGISDKTNKERFLGIAYIEVEPIKNLRLKGNFGIDRNMQKRKVYLPKTTLYGKKEGGKADIVQDEKNDYLTEFTASYAKTLGNHSFTALGGYSFQRFQREGFSAGNSQFMTDGFLANNLGEGAAPKPGVGSSSSSDEMASYFGRLNYVLMDKYLLTATFRADGASNFAPNKQWGYFPSVAVGWRFSDESFMTPVTNVLSNGKLRLSYGQTGNADIGDRILTYYKVQSNGSFGGTQAQGVGLSQLGNPDLKWETTTEWNLGLELGFFDNKISVTAEYYSRVISDLLNKRKLQTINEVNEIYANTGKTQSKGFELTVNTQNVQTRNFNWYSDFTFSFYRDKWKQRYPEWRSSYIKANGPIRAEYGYLSDGIVKAGEAIPHMGGAIPGQVKLKDIDGFKRNGDGKFAVDEYGQLLRTGAPDGILDDADKVLYGSNDPGYILGLNNSFKWKEWDLNVFFYGQFKNYKYGSYKDRWLSGADGMTGVINIYRGYNMPETIKDIWTHDNQDASRPGYFQDKSSYGVGDFYKQDAWFVRCRNITLGYNFRMPQGKKLFSNVRVYFDVNNPFVITKYKGLDPETDNNVWAYPNIRSYSFGLDITF